MLRLWDLHVEISHEAHEQLGLDPPILRCRRYHLELLSKRLSEYGEEKIEQALRGVLCSDWHMGLGRHEDQAPKLALESALRVSRKIDQVQVLSSLYRKRHRFDRFAAGEDDGAEVFEKPPEAEAEEEAVEGAA